MTVQTLEVEPQSTLVVQVRGTLTRDDYRDFLSDIERAAREDGRIRLLFLMSGCRGWEPMLTGEMGLEPRIFSAVERLAVVGAKEWENWMEEFSRPFFGIKIGYFDTSQEEEARRWLASD